MPVKILIFEDNNNLREGLCQLLMLREEFQIVGNYGEARQAKEIVIKCRPDVVLMDIDMPGINGVEAVRQIREYDLTTQIIMLTVFDDNSHVFDALMAGANGYLLKRNVSDRLVLAIQEVLEGGAPMSPSIARLVINQLHVQKPTNQYMLSEREKEILRSLSKGNSFKLIAADLGISFETVRTHIKRIYDKLHVHSQGEAISKALHEKLV
ncbi:two component transcriptional regulator, LuxR family [Aquiflexum balticum DSM 16537]|uniref:Two component transcriptional regulator, LuxR family n=1 Tax=Aquiflexum balticum DSM 16537 TaxID=758820 RepID=A0A1W2HAJ1_9BACT|nr:response regulator transcription factor [Aquiflexum balticum]SMD45897.1 two component transcriptional regulator, LuxR family [Aquiflexum balticum DSM 16537]